MIASVVALARRLPAGPATQARVAMVAMVARTAAMAMLAAVVALSPCQAGAQGAPIDPTAPGGPAPGGRPDSVSAATAPASPPETERFQARGQFTFVRQYKPSFGAAYSGPNSLAANREYSYSGTATAMLGARAWEGAEFYLNPEVAAGVPLSNLTGFGGFPNGELARTSGPTPTLYLGRLFWRQTWNAGPADQPVESAQNQLAGAVAKRRLVLTAGIVSILDIFDQNAYSHDPRTQFLNWSLVTHGSFDFAADSRGYTRGVALEWFDDGWAIRAGRFMMPRESNGLPLNRALGRSHGDQVELEKDYRLLDQPGTVRLLYWRNRAVMASYSEAVEQAAARGGAPDLASVRRDRAKWGWGLAIEQALGRWGGLFMRYSNSQDRFETFSYTEIGQSVSGGVLIDGKNWQRASDSLGLAFAQNRLRSPHSGFLAAGGTGFFLGDGALNYRSERITEAFYSIGVLRDTSVTLNVQYVVNPGYNADRGPARIVGVRLHTDF